VKILKKKRGTPAERGRSSWGGDIERFKPRETANHHRAGDEKAKHYLDTEKKKALANLSKRSLAKKTSSHKKGGLITKGPTRGLHQPEKR